MMDGTIMGLVIAVTTATFVWRYIGFLPSAKYHSKFVEDFLRFVPISTFAVLVTTALVKQPDFMGVKGLALVVAGVVMWRTRQFGLSVVVGMGVVWFVQY